MIAAVIALADPQELVIGGSWGLALADAIRTAAARLPRQVSLRTAAVTEDPVLAGVRAEALTRLRTQIAATD
ncbi:hypothetical protein AB0M02_18325 [Actinoplanes sp. NPDC051861]|uniref:hypothetical protein n=1 Tax=Actinoplanes sp. NPDC051861 TaxID=3155170 RepID=UPI00341E0789